MTKERPEAVYLLLEIIANTPQTEIWLGDDAGSLVVKKTGRLRERLLPGDYVVEFGLGTPCYPVPLDAGSKYTQADLELAGPCEPPVFQLPPGETYESRPITNRVLRKLLSKIDFDG